MSPEGFWSGGSLHPNNKNGQDVEEAEGEAAGNEGSAVQKRDSQAKSTHQPNSAPAELNHGVTTVERYCAHLFCRVTVPLLHRFPVSYTHLTLPTNHRV